MTPRRGSLPESAILATIGRQYAETRARLASDPQYQAMKIAAAKEEIETPDYYWARNMLALHEEINMPGIQATVARARLEYQAQSPTGWQRLLRALGLGGKA